MVLNSVPPGTEFDPAGSGSYSIGALARHKFPPDDFWWGPNILPKGGLMLVASPPKVGKSWVVLSVIRALVLQEPVFGHDKFSVPSKARVLYMDQEISPSRLQERVLRVFTPDEIAGTERDRSFYACSRHPDISFSTPEGVLRIQNEVASVRPDVLILDPIANMHSFEENDAGGIGELFSRLEELRYLGRSWGLSIIVVHHTRKPPEESASYDALASRSIRGSSKFISMPDAILMLEKGRGLDTPHRAWSIKARFSDLRHTEDLDDFFLDVNRNGDLRVEFARYANSTFLQEGVPRVTAKPRGGARAPLPEVGRNPFEGVSPVKTFDCGFSLIG